MTLDDGAPAGRARAYHLPALLAEIAEEVGLPAALAIAQVKGGTRVHFPASCPDDHWLVATVGREKADRLCGHFSVRETGGVSLNVPLGPTKLYDRARFRVLELLDLGHSIADTAREVGVSARAVEKWSAAERKRRAMRRAGRGTSPTGDVAHLTRVYDPVSDGLMSRLAPPAPPADARQPAPAPGRNAPRLPHLDTAALPGFLPEVAEVAGIGVALVLGTIKGGRVLHVTDHQGRAGELVRLVGPSSAEKVAAHFRARHPGDVELLVPRCPPETFTTVAGWAEAARQDGCSSADLADWLGLTPAMVEHLCAAMRATVGSGYSFRAGFPYHEPEREG